MTISRTPEYEAAVQAHAAAHGPYLAMRTLLGGPTDRNRRTIENILTGERLDVFNQNMGEWTPELESALTARLKELNDAYLMETK